MGLGRGSRLPCPSCFRFQKCRMHASDVWRESSRRDRFGGRVALSSCSPLGKHELLICSSHLRVNDHVKGASGFPEGEFRLV